MGAYCAKRDVTGTVAAVDTTVATVVNGAAVFAAADTGLGTGIGALTTIVNVLVSNDLMGLVWRTAMGKGDAPQCLSNVKWAIPEAGHVSISSGGLVWIVCGRAWA